MARLSGRRGGAARTASAATALVMALGLAACGSQLDPATVAHENSSANGGTAPTGAGTGTTGGGDTTTAGGDTTTGGGDTTTTGGGDTTTTGGGDTTTSGGGDTTTSTGGGSSSAGNGGGTGGGHGGGGHSSTGDGGSSSGNDGGQTTTAASCDGLQNGTGVTDSTITIGNSSDLSGPVPGLFTSAQDAVKAFVAYFNSSQTLCGRKLALTTYDSRTDASADQQAYASACSQVFAMVGSQSAFDSGGAATDQSCGLPDIRATAVTKERNACSVCFGAESVNTGQWQNTVGDFVKKNYPDAYSHAAMLYINAGAGAENGPIEAAAMTKQGMHFDVVQGIDVSEFNYAPYVQQLKDKGVNVVFWVGAYQQSVRLAQAMQQQGYKPELYLRDPTDYIPDFVSSGGSAVDGTVVFLNFVPFEEASSNKEEQLYTSWLQQVHPGASPTFFGVFAWSAARLFVTKAAELGGKLTRASLVQAIKATDNWTDNGMTSPQHVGPKKSGDCWRFVQLSGGQWKPVGGTKYQCDGITTG